MACRSRNSFGVVGDILERDSPHNHSPRLRAPTMAVERTATQLPGRAREERLTISAGCVRHLQLEPEQKQHAHRAGHESAPAPPLSSPARLIISLIALALPPPCHCARAADVCTSLGVGASARRIHHAVANAHRVEARGGRVTSRRAPFRGRAEAGSGSWKLELEVEAGSGSWKLEAEAGSILRK